MIALFSKHHPKNKTQKRKQFSNTYFFSHQQLSRHGAVVPNGGRKEIEKSSADPLSDHLDCTSRGDIGHQKEDYLRSTAGTAGHQ